ncbi:MAG: nitroreductase family protein, partial [Ilumatobacter sp.]
MTSTDPTDPTDVPGIDALAKLIRSRRTSMLVDQARDVPVDVVEQLCELASWAPNHKKTWPWRFALFTGDARRRLGESMATDMVAVD